MNVRGPDIKSPIAEQFRAWLKTAVRPPYPVDAPIAAGAWRWITATPPAVCAGFCVHCVTRPSASLVIAHSA